MYYLLAVYVPQSHSKELKSRLFEVGAGKYGNYDCCAFEYAGTGSFRPIEGSSPFIGKIGEIEQVQEIKIEMLFEKKLKKQIKKCINDHHPYETPAFHFIKVDL